MSFFALLHPSTEKNILTVKKNRRRTTQDECKYCNFLCFSVKHKTNNKKKENKYKQEAQKIVFFLCFLFHGLISTIVFYRTQQFVLLCWLLIPVFVVQELDGFSVRAQNNRRTSAQFAIDETNSFIYLFFYYCY